MITLDKEPKIKTWFENLPDSLPQFTKDVLDSIDIENAFKTVVSENMAYIFDKDLKHVHIITIGDGQVIVFFNAVLTSEKEEDRIEYDPKKGGHHKVICEYTQEGM